MTTTEKPIEGAYLGTRIRVGFVVMLLFLVVSGIGMPALNLVLKEPPPTELKPIATLPEFSFAALQEGGAGRVDLASLRGKVWVADFVFTSCPNVCISMSTQMARLQRAILTWPAALRDDVRLVSFTVDPRRDTLERLSDYARLYGADLATWHFARGEEGEVGELMRDGFGVPIPVPSAGDIVHFSRFALVDRAGVVRGFYEGYDRDASGLLLRDIRRLLGEGRGE